MKCKPWDKGSGRTVHTRDGPMSQRCQSRELTQPRPYSQAVFRPRMERGMCLQGNPTVQSQTPSFYFLRARSSSRRSPWEVTLFQRGLPSPSFKANRSIHAAGDSLPSQPPSVGGGEGCTLAAHLIDKKTEPLGDQITNPESNSYWKAELGLSQLPDPSKGFPQQHRPVCLWPRVIFTFSL